MITRESAGRLDYLLEHFPAVGLLGPRQLGKTTLARSLVSRRHMTARYLDLELPADLARLSDPQDYLSRHGGQLVILDEVQRQPEIFRVLRGVIDARRQAGERCRQFLLLGSAPIDMLQQSSESLAGRIAYMELPPLLATEIVGHQEALWLRGGFPDSFLAADDTASFEWRIAFIRTYLERDIPALGPRIPATTLRRLWTMLAHDQGAMLNAARLAGALGISGQTVTRYIDLLVDLLLVRRLQPWASNVGKRLVRSPKVYVRDSGLVHALLNLRTLDDLLGHPVAGTSWEGMVVETLLASAQEGATASFYRAAGGAEIDLILELDPKNRWAIEMKRSSAPTISKGFFAGCADIAATRRVVVYPGRESFQLGHGIEAMSLEDAAAAVKGA